MSTTPDEKPLPNGLKQLGLNRREQIALRILQSLLRTEAPKARRGHAKSLADEAFMIADSFLERAAKP